VDTNRVYLTGPSMSGYGTWKLGVKDVSLTVYPEAKHNSWTETYSNPELYE